MGRAFNAWIASTQEAAIRQHRRRRILLGLLSIPVAFGLLYLAVRVVRLAWGAP